MSESEHLKTNNAEPSSSQGPALPQQPPRQKIRLWIGAAVVILAGGLAIYYQLSKVQFDTLTHYSTLVGGKLLSMVPEGSGKEQLASLYQEFLERVENRQVSPEAVERVAAGVLNASNRRETLTPQEAEAVLQLAFHDVGPDTAAPPSPPTVAVKVRDSREWEKLGDRLKLAYEFNEKMLQGHPETAGHTHQMDKKIQFQVQDGLKVIIDDTLQTMLAKDEELRGMAKELAALQKEKMVIWRKELQKEVEAGLKIAEKELQRMQKELADKGIQVELAKPDIQKALESLKIIDSLGIPAPVNIDSIMREVEIEIKKAETERKNKGK